jgi:trans-2,3-dihydro-3-hydroxyanthranilate isomerase
MPSIPEIHEARVRWVDGFATAPLTGNPLVVVLCEAHPPTAAMQALAAEFGLSETVFVASGDPIQLRIFTPTTEIPMAGHPMAGAAWVLRDEGWIPDEATLHTPAGAIGVRAGDHGAHIAPPAPRHVTNVDAAPLAAALGTVAGGAVPVWNAGLTQVMLPVDDPAVLTPNHGALRALGAQDGWDGVSAYRITQVAPGQVRAEVRHFAAPIGIDEDPVTGSAAGALGAALAADHTANGALSLTVRQGHGMGRAGEVTVEVAADSAGPTSLWVGGRVLPVMAGRIA